MNYHIDLHFHTYPESTDATQSYEELMEVAIRHRVKYLSITNHDSITNQDLFKTEAEKRGLIYFKGVEITCTITNPSIIGYPVTVDLLAYNYDWIEDEFKAFIQKNKTINQERIKEKIKRVETKFNIKIESAKADRQIAEIMFQKGLFPSIRDAKHFIKLDPMFGDIQKLHVSLEETVKEVINHKGIIIMAHPFRKTIKKLGPFTIEEMKKLMPYYKSLGIHGLETYHPENMVENRYLLLESYVKDNHMLSSIGSDRHGVGDFNQEHFLFKIILDEDKLLETISYLKK